MLNIKTVKNPLVTDTEKDGYCFRSTCSQSLSTDKLAAEMADYNSSFTQADNIGMLNVLNTVVTKYLAKGYSIEFPFGNLRPNVTGTCASIQDGFSLGSGNHQLSFLFNADDETAKKVRSTLEYRQLPPDITGESKIYRATVLQSDASESADLSATAGKTLRLHGRNLTFDIADSAQGVFLENESGLSRMATYSRRGSNIVDAIIPANLTAGNYSISIVTKPGKTYFTANIDAEITITAS